MKIAVIGVGAIGSTIAALLANAGHTVQVQARENALDELTINGIRLTGAFGSVTGHVHAVSALTVSPDLAFVATKAQDAAAAVHGNATLLSGIPVVVVQNGLESITAAKEAAPASDIVGGLALYAASYVSAGEVTVTTGGPTYLGGDLVPTLYAATTLETVMPVIRTANFEGAQWTKLVVNHVNALPAITGMSVQEVIDDRSLRLIMTESMREAVRVARATGIVFEKMQGLSDARLSLLLRAPLSVGQALPRAMKARMGATPNPGSTLQSIRRGQPTEIDYLNGAIVARGLEAGVPTPVSAAIVAMVHEVEAGSGFLSPETVAARVAAAR